CAAENRDLRPELRTGGSHRLLRTEVRTSESAQRPPELLPVGSARLHGREHDRDGRSPRAAGIAIRFGRIHRARRPPLGHAIRAFRFFLLPRTTPAVARSLAPGKSLALA